MTTREISGWSMLVFCGLWAGGVLVIAFERTHIWRQMPIDEYAVDFRRSLLLADPTMPVLGMIAASSAGIFAINSSGIARSLALGGLAGVLLIIATSVIIAGPINLKFRRLPEGQTPDRAAYYRITWQRFHLARTVMTLLTFGSFAGAAVALSLP